MLQGEPRVVFSVFRKMRSLASAMVAGVVKIIANLVWGLSFCFYNLAGGLLAAKNYIRFLSGFGRPFAFGL
jgi:hypothetical protein